MRGACARPLLGAEGKGCVHTATIERGINYWGRGGRGLCGGPQKLSATSPRPLPQPNGLAGACARATEKAFCVWLGLRVWTLLGRWGVLMRWALWTWWTKTIEGFAWLEARMDTKG